MTVMLRDQRRESLGTNRAKIEKILIYRAIGFGILHSLVNTTRCEANKNNWRREERPIGQCTVKMLRNLRRPARGLALLVAAEVRARMHNWAIWCKGSSRAVECVMAHSKTRPARGEQTQQNSAHGGGNLDCSIQLSFSRSPGSTTSNEAIKSAMLCAEWTIATRWAVLRLAQMKYGFFVPERCKQNAIFSGTSHQNRIYLDNVSTEIKLFWFF